ncbi:Olfactory receptor 6C4 [Lemmus lemmus]
MRNHTAITTFILLGLTDNPVLQVLLFLFLFLTYMLSVAGDLTIIALMLLVGATEFYLLTAMSYDRYVAICRPLHYTTIMSNRVCFLLVLCSWLSGFLIILFLIILTSQLDFCASNVLNHYYCDYAPLIEVACSDTRLLKLIEFVLAVMTLIVTLVLVILSYTHIIRTILKIPSAQQRKKAFSTCSSHMVVISLSYGSCIFMYIKPSATEGVAFNKGVAVLNNSVAPLLNPFIYTLRNKQVKQAFSDAVRKVLHLYSF